MTDSIARIPFRNKLHDKIGDTLLSIGFELILSESQPAELLIYQRPSENSEFPDQITFNGGEHTINTIYGGAVSKGSTLIKLQELMPNYSSLSFPESHRWEYTELNIDKVITEIADFVQDFVIKWLDSPS